MPAALLGFFMVTLDAVVVNVTLPTIRADLGGGVAGLQWVVDGYTLMFAALLLTAVASTVLERVAPSPRAWSCSSWRRSPTRGSQCHPAGRPATRTPTRREEPP